MFLKEKIRMFAYGCFDKFINDLSWREENSYDIPITIGLLICDLRQQFCLENILNYMNHFNRFSGEYINFYIPGYCSNDEMITLERNGYGKFYRDFYNICGVEYYFSEKYFDEFIFKLRELYDICYLGKPELILFEVSKGQINWDNKIRFCLSNMQEDGKIESVYSFFDLIFQYAKKYVDIEDISKAGRSNQLKRSLFQIIKDKIPENATLLYENDSMYHIK